MEGTGDVTGVGTVEGKQIGKVSRFFPRISVIVFEPSDILRVGDSVRIIGKGKTRRRKIDFIQKVESMQINHEQIEEAHPGEPIGLKVNEEVREGCSVFKL